MPVTLMRHAHTEWNDSPKIFQGYFDVYLSEKGKQETLLKSNSMSDFEFVYSSTASRCIETVNILLGATEKIILDDRLLEIDTGEFTGKTNDEVVWESLKLSSSDKFVSNLPDGLDTVIGNGGVGLSGGQIKRIDLATPINHGNVILRPFILYLKCIYSGSNQPFSCVLIDNPQSVGTKFIRSYTE